MKKLKTITPYSDDSLTYDETTKKYYLTLDFCKAEFDPNFRDDAVLEKRIRKNTRVIYNFIHSRINNSNTQIVDFIITNTQEGRDFMLKLLETQMEADVDNGFNDLSLTPAINVSNGQIIDREEIRRNLVTVEVENLFYNSAKYLGINISYAGPFPPATLLYLR